MTMLEKVSDAIQEAELGNNWADMARAAIEAMREPTPEMVKAAFYLYTGYEKLGPTKPVFNGTSMWHSMIDAALKEKP